MDMNYSLYTGTVTLSDELILQYDRNGVPYCRFPVAVQDKKRETLINTVIFGKLAESAVRYLKDGSRVAVAGKIRTGSYVKDDGSVVYTTDVTVTEIDYISL